MLKTLVTGDWQLDSRPACDRRDSKGKSIRFEENVQVLLDMVKTASEKGCQRMIFLGDLTEELNPDSKSLDAAALIFRTAIDCGLVIDAVAGNHDGSIYEVSSSSIEPLGRMVDHDRFRVHHKVGYFNKGNINYIFLPYLHEMSPEQIRAELVGITEVLQGDLYLFGHYGAKQSRMGAKNLLLPGDYLDADTMLADQFKRIYMGHIHKAQEFVVGNTPFHHPGSPYICDFGERDDPKGYCIFDPESNSNAWFELKPKRRWLSIDYHEIEKAEADHMAAGGKLDSFELPWTESDIVKLTGNYGEGKNPREYVRGRIKNGEWKRPFFVTDEFKRIREERDVRAGVDAVSGASGFAEAISAFVSKKWPSHPRTAEIIKTVAEELKESKLASVEPFVIPTRVVATDFMSHKLMEFELPAGQTTLVVGPMGIGKTNILEAILFAITGETSKRLKNPMLVRQGGKKASVLLFLAGGKHLFFIQRSITLTKTGSTQSVKAGMTLAEGADPDWYTDKKKYQSLADGGVNDTQVAISAIVGATYKSLKATNFMFQKDPSPFIKAEPAERKGILAEILGFEPMAKAFKTLDDKRKAAARALADRKAELEGLRSAIDPSKEKETVETLASAEAKVPGLKKDVEAKETQASRKKADQQIVSENLEKLNRELVDMPDSSGLLTGSRDTLAVAEKNFSENRERLAKSYASDRSQIASIKAEMVATDVATIQKQIEAFNFDIKKREEILADVKPVIDKANETKTRANAALDVLDNEHVSFGRQISSLQNDNIDTCSKCGAKVDSSHIKKEIEDLKAKDQENRQACAKHNIDIQEADKTLIAMNGQKEIAEAAIKNANMALQDLNAKLSRANSLGEELKRLEERFAETERQGIKLKDDYEAKKKEVEAKIAELEKKVDVEKKLRAEKEAVKTEVWNQLQAAKDRTDQAVKELSDAKVLLAGTESTIEALKKAIEGFAETKKKIEEKEKAIVEAQSEHELRILCADVLNPTAGLPVWLIDARLPELEDAINRYMEVFGASGLSIRLSTVTEDGKETLDVLVDNGEEPMLDVAAYSGGQNDCMEASLKWALADLAESMRDVRLGILAYDEPGVHLDEERKAKLVEMIHDRCMSGRTPVAIVISHDRKLMSGFQRRLTIAKTDDATEIIPA